MDGGKEARRTGASERAREYARKGGREGWTEAGREEKSERGCKDEAGGEVAEASWPRVQQQVGRGGGVRVRDEGSAS